MQSAADQASERDYLLDRLQHLRAILPAFAQELASARRQAARLKLENAGLAEQVRELQRHGTPMSHAGLDSHRDSPRRRAGTPAPVLTVR